MTTTTDTGGPAFPLHTAEWHEEVNQKGYAQHDFTMGMTLRDYFAAKAMQGMLAANGDSNGYLEYEEKTVAANAYRLADAMLKSREA